MKLISQSLVGRAVGPSLYMPGTTTKLSTLFQVLVLHLTVTEININKLVQKQDLENIKNVKRCRDGMPKSMQTR